MNVLVVVFYLTNRALESPAVKPFNVSICQTVVVLSVLVISFPYWPSVALFYIKHHWWTDWNLN